MVSEIFFNIDNLTAQIQGSFVKGEGQTFIFITMETSSKVKVTEADVIVVGAGLSGKQPEPLGHRGPTSLWKLGSPRA